MLCREWDFGPTVITSGRNGKDGAEMKYRASLAVSRWSSLAPTVVLASALLTSFWRPGGGTVLANEAAAAAADASRGTVLHSPSGTAGGSGAGMTIHVDPRSGALAPAAAASGRSVLRAPEQAAGVEASSAELPESPGNSPAGGIKLDLKGRFRSAVVLREGPDGQVKSDCEPAGVDAQR